MPADMSTARLTYFDISSSRGEDCRMALYVAGVPFEDRRLQRGDWKELKPNTPYGCLPMLEVEGKPALAQSNAILGYIGRTYGLLPSDPWQAACHDAVLECVEELRHKLAATSLGEEAGLAERRAEFVEKILRPWAKNVERQIKGPFLEGEQLSVADLKLFTIIGSLQRGTYDHIPQDVLSTYPALGKLHQAVAAHPKVAEWRARGQAG